jgi:hypothetical protein
VISHLYKYKLISLYRETVDTQIADSHSRPTRLICSDSTCYRKDMPLCGREHLGDDIWSFTLINIEVRKVDNSKVYCIKLPQKTAEWHIFLLEALNSPVKRTTNSREHSALQIPCSGPFRVPVFAKYAIRPPFIVRPHLSSGSETRNSLLLTGNNILKTEFVHF